LDASKRVNLINIKDISYHITMNLGIPESQPVKLVLDTGSEYFAVTSNLCRKDRKDQDLLSTYSSYNVDMAQLQEEDQSDAKTQDRCGSSAYNIMASQS
jgi:hypothetical protein